MVLGDKIVVAVGDKEGMKDGEVLGEEEWTVKHSAGDTADRGALETAAS